MRRRRHLSPCRTSQRTGRAGRSGEPDFPCPYFVTFPGGPSQIPLCSWFPCLLISVDFHSFREPVVKHHFTCDQQVHTLSLKGRGCAPPPCPGGSVYVPTRIVTSCLQVAFLNDAGANAQEYQRVCCQPLAHPVASSQRTPGTGGESVCGETHRALHGAISAGVGVGVNLGASTSMTAKHPSLQVNLLELQGQVLWLVGDHNEGHDKFLTTAQSPADQPALGARIPQELGCADKQGGG